MKRYVKVTVRPYRILRYPARAREMVFTMPHRHAVQAVEMLMTYMGYGCGQYRIVSAEDTSCAGAAKNKENNTTKPDDMNGSIPVGDEQEGADICSRCDRVAEYGTMEAVSEESFDLLCDECRIKGDR
jgi:hypothetical protein